MNEDQEEKIEGYKIGIKDLKDGGVKISIEGETPENSDEDSKAFQLTSIIIAMLRRIQDGKIDDFTA